MLFLLAGIEVDPLALRNRDGARAVIAWCASLVLAVAWIYLLSQVIHINARVAGRSRASPPWWPGAC
jgi:hypothetical protein